MQNRDDNRSKLWRMGAGALLPIARISCFRLQFISSRILICVSSAKQASRVASIASEFSPISHISCEKGDERRAGIYTTAEVKERMRHELQRMLREKRICITENMRSTRQGTMKELMKQLNRCEYVYKPGTGTAHAERRRAITGKINGQNDDMAIALMMLSYWSSYFINTGGRCAATV